MKKAQYKFYWLTAVNVFVRMFGNWTGSMIGRGAMRGTKYGVSAASYPYLDIAGFLRLPQQRFISIISGRLSMAMNCNRPLPSSRFILLLTPASRGQVRLFSKQQMSPLVVLCARYAFCCQSTRTGRFRTRNTCPKAVFCLAAKRLVQFPLRLDPPRADGDICVDGSLARSLVAKSNEAREIGSRYPRSDADP